MAYESGGAARATEISPCLPSSYDAGRCQSFGFHTSRKSMYAEPTIPTKLTNSITQ